MGIKIDDNSKITLTLKKQKLREDSFVVGDETRGTFVELPQEAIQDRKSTRLNSSHA